MNETVLKGILTTLTTLIYQVKIDNALNAEQGALLESYRDALLNEIQRI